MIERFVRIVILLVLASATYMRNDIWCNDMLLWENAAHGSTKARTHFNIGRVYQDRELLDKALAEYLMVVRLDPDYPNVHNNLGTIYYAWGDDRDSINEFEKAVQSNPKLTFAHFTLGDLYTKQGRSDEALEHYLRALELKPASPYINNNLGLLYLKRGRYQDAISHFQTALMFYPNYGEALQNLTQARQKLSYKSSR